MSPVASLRPSREHSTMKACETPSLCFTGIDVPEHCGRHDSMSIPIRRQERLCLGSRSVSLDPVIFMAEGEGFPKCLQSNAAAQNKVTAPQVVTRTPDTRLKA